MGFTRNTFVASTLCDTLMKVEVYLDGPGSTLSFTLIVKDDVPHDLSTHSDLSSAIALLSIIGDASVVSMSGVYRGADRT